MCDRNKDAMQQRLYKRVINVLCTIRNRNKKLQEN